ncbi:hypothetical protein OOK31_19225 [Streptomyces sp. NBC_00249]|uniref:hypothetical protein n=1 Tax=Streptomyces sp. NBC_00249 TaxID=2975690 RepID=UPI00224E020D|nr:hypothetical protein [Streptomyces sp. NBC_00249]MCX5195999.1 hypothetical protein [Streptomyces sp. NBC_00249]
MRDDHKNPPGPGTPGPAPGDEQALRSLLAGAVQGLEPCDGALERLRHAVPARRARKRQALVGAAAAALLAGTAIPAALHLSADQGASAERSTMAGHGQTQSGRTTGPSDPQQNGTGGFAEPRPSRSPGQGQETGGGAGTQPSPRASGSPSGGPVAGSSSAGASAGTGSGAASGAAGHGPLPPLGAAPGTTPGCTADQLGVAASARAPEADGKVFGAFKVTNVSVRGCVVTGPDTVTAASLDAPPPPAQGASGVTVTSHTAGDPASGLLPDPSAETPVLLLQPNTAYEVRFAWVPSAQSCPAATPTASAKPEQAETGGSPAAPPAVQEGAAADSGEASAPPLISGGTGTAPAGVEVSHTPGTPVAGAPVTQATIPEACGGTVYRTGLIAPAAP